MRLGFTIVFNGLHHLQHNGFAYRMADLLDIWNVVEGPARNVGSTQWCNAIPEKYVADNHSTDGTRTFLRQLVHCNERGNVILNGGQPYNAWWNGKDQMVNSAVESLEWHANNTRMQKAVQDMTDSSVPLVLPEGAPIFLWQIDVDEQWTKEQMDDAERELVESGGDCGCFHCDYWLGRHLRAVGTWGEGCDPTDSLRNAYRRLWRWDGRKFATHEPPTLEGGNGKEVLLSPRFQHYAYRFEKDAEFKEAYYSGHDGILDRWRRLQSRPAEDFPLPISELITGPWGETDTKIVRDA